MDPDCSFDVYSTSIEDVIEKILIDLYILYSLKVDGRFSMYNEVKSTKTVG